MSKLINQGGFGCIFYPGFNCEGKTKKTGYQLVTKLVIDDFNARNEIFIGSIIKQISQYDFFFLPVNSSCPINLASINKTYINKCNILTTDNDKYLLLELSYLKNISFKKLFSDPTRISKHLFLTFIETFQYVVTGINYLIEKNIVHYDIHQNNILYSIKYENPILIDFGLSIPINKLTETNLSDYFYIYSPDYYLWPIEVHAINFLVNVGDELTTSVIKQLISTYMHNNSAFDIFTSDFRKMYTSMAIQFLSKYKHINKYIVIKELIQFYRTWDIYALSLMYLKFFKILFRDGFFYSKFIINFSQLLLVNIFS